jgi:hypothetical protein
VCVHSCRGTGDDDDVIVARHTCSGIVLRQPRERVN